MLANLNNNHNNHNNSNNNNNHNNKHTTTNDKKTHKTVVDLADVQKALVARQQLAGYEMTQRFFEIGSHEGLQELDALLRKQ